LSNQTVTWVESKEDFDALLSNSDYVVVDFTAPSWCRPCQQFAPHFEKAADAASVRSDMLGRATFVAVDVDKAPWAMEDYGVQGIPTVKLISRLHTPLEPVTLKERTVIKLLDEINNFFHH
jgi:thiol-disulfide isomerase/thioredoxin